MAITLELKPEIEARLLAEAQAAGLSLDEFLSRELEAIAPAAFPQRREDQWEKELDEWLDSFPQRPVLNDEVLRRENWYPDRW